MKRMVKLLALLTVLCMVLCACAKSDEELIVGTWKGTVECGDYFNDLMATQLGDMADYFDFGDLSFDLLLTFDEDGEYEIELDEDSVDAFSDECVEIMRASLRDYMEDAFASQLGDKSLDAYLESLGYSFDELMAESGMDTEALTGSMMDAFSSAENKGDYEVDDGELDMDGSIHEYELDGDKLTIEAPEDADDEMAEILFPLELKRVK